MEIIGQVRGYFITLGCHTKCFKEDIEILKMGHVCKTFEKYKCYCLTMSGCEYKGYGEKSNMMGLLGTKNINTKIFNTLYKKIWELLLKK